MSSSSQAVSVNSPHFIESIKYSRKVGYNSVQAATTVSSSQRARISAARQLEAGLHMSISFDGIGNDANSHRQVGNLFDVKCALINNLH